MRLSDLITLLLDFNDNLSDALTSPTRPVPPYGMVFIWSWHFLIWLGEFSIKLIQAYKDTKPKQVHNDLKPNRKALKPSVMSNPEFPWRNLLKTTVMG